MEFVMDMVWMGVAATALIDAWALLRRRLFALPLPDYALVGRWFGHMPRGRFVHASMAAATPVRGEALIGWSAHYLIGVVYAAMLLAIVGPGWLQAPTLAPALLFGVLSVAAPFLLMQPGMGLGIAARRAPRPQLARLHSLIFHTLFGLGLYLTALALPWLGLR